MRFTTCVIPAAGKGTRMGDPHTPKCMKLANGDALLEHVIRFWQPMCDRFVVLVGDVGIGRIATVMDHYVPGQWCPVGFPAESIAGSVWEARDKIEGPFVVALADCLFEGEFHWPQDYNVCGVAMQRRSDDWGNSFAVGLTQHGTVARVIEKPDLGLGAWFFRHCDRRHFSDGGGMEDVLARAMKSMVSVYGVHFEGRYLNANTPEDLERWG